MFESVLPKNAQTALALLGNSNPFPSDTYLAGGSALALHFGHRKSVDFDFFTPTAFDPKKLSESLSLLGSFDEEVAKGISLIGKFQGVKLSCFQYQYSLLKQPLVHLGVLVAHPNDIAPMKLVAICDRGTKKDFVDIYTMVQNGLTLEDMFTLYDKKYGLLESNRYTLCKALGYLDEADLTDMPEMLISLSWKEVKQFFIAQAMRLGKQYIEG
ncbi:nucleotidyl transferase AbiEii/AbiGii toxin family protein [Candidatus Gottesmanbacteria bacterium]|nr:nucleotidyl transferase AbiEii/AbiGii toxin family protein [Candidatus Gottesmanbacteria bacterium]